MSQFNFGYYIKQKRRIIVLLNLHLAVPDSMRPKPDCMVNMMKALVRIHVASS